MKSIRSQIDEMWVASQDHLKKISNKSVSQFCQCFFSYLGCLISLSLSVSFASCQSPSTQSSGSSSVSQDLSPSNVNIKADIFVKSERTGEKYECLPVSSNPKLFYPTDLAVTNDGKTVYAVTRGCSGEGAEKYLKGQLPGCGFSLTNANKLTHKFLFRIDQGKSPEFLNPQTPPNLGCTIGDEIEIDQNSNLYLVNEIDKGILRIDTSFNKRDLLMISEKSEAFTSALPPYPAPEFSMPYGLQISNGKLYFEILSPSTYSDHRLRSIDLTTGQLSERLKTVALLRERIENYAVYDGAIFMYAKSNDFGPYQVEGFPSLLSFGNIQIPVNNMIPSVYQPLSTKFFSKIDKDIYPKALRADNKGIFYLADTNNHLIWKMVLNSDMSKGEINILAGSGEKGYKDGQGKDARFYFPAALSIDGNGNLYVADTGNSAIRKVSPEGLVTTFYGEKSH